MMRRRLTKMIRDSPCWLPFAFSQHEKAYQKQDAIFVGAKRVLGKKVAKVSYLQ